MNDTSTGMTALQRLVQTHQERYGTIIAEEYEKELADLRGRAAALSSLLEAICGKGFEVKAGFEEATRQAIHTWSEVAGAARYGEDEYP